MGWDGNIDWRFDFSTILVQQAGFFSKIYGYRVKQYLDFGQRWERTPVFILRVGGTKTDKGIYYLSTIFEPRYNTFSPRDIVTTHLCLNY